MQSWSRRVRRVQLYPPMLRHWSARRATGLSSSTEGPLWYQHQWEAQSAWDLSRYKEETGAEGTSYIIKCVVSPILHRQGRPAHTQTERACADQTSRVEAAAATGGLLLLGARRHLSEDIQPPSARTAATGLAAGTAGPEKQGMSFLADSPSAQAVEVRP